MKTRTPSAVKISVVRLLVLSSFSIFLHEGPAFAGKCEREFAHAARKYGVPVKVLTAVGQTETGRGDGLRPNALNIAGKSHYDLTLSQALSLFTKARSSGIKLIDVGCMQINHHYHKQHFASVAEMFDPNRNVDYAANFLRRLYNEEKSWTMAVARYHAGKKNHKAQKRYVCAVIKKLVMAGHGAWTASARRFCGNPHAPPIEATSRAVGWKATVSRTDAITDD